MIIPKQLMDEISQYCQINSIKDTDEFILKLIKRGFTVEKYGSVPYVEPVVTPEEPKTVVAQINKTAEVKKDIYGEN